MQTKKTLLLYKKDLNNDGQKLLIEEVESYHISLTDLDFKAADRVVYEDPIGNRKRLKDRFPELETSEMRIVIRPTPSMSYEDICAYVKEAFREEQEEEVTA